MEELNFEDLIKANEEKEKKELPEDLLKELSEEDLKNLVSLLEKKREKTEKTKEKATKEKKSSHPPYPKVIAGVCEFCGKPASECEVLGEMMKKGTFKCLCDAWYDKDKFYQAVFMYYPKLKTWICSTEGCKSRLEYMGVVSREDVDIINFLRFKR